MFDACDSATVRPNLSLVICTLDEAASIGAVLDQARSALAGRAFEIIVVDDSADEATGDAVRAAAADDPRIRLIRRAGARGLASAAIDGWDAAGGDILAIMAGRVRYRHSQPLPAWNRHGASRRAPGDQPGRNCRVAPADRRARHRSDERALPDASRLVRRREAAPQRPRL
jgi:hypothetical protein